jgi:hypothetical protein
MCKCNLGDDSAGFVAHDHRLLELEVPAGAALPVVHVRPADAHAVHAQEYLWNHISQQSFEVNLLIINPLSAADV